ncbi:hypothetical protein BHYA_0019g00280 [Botrytis hyacinthi]|uniref:Ketoreductase (KR) domain-containing protein n=1 Tax=Botrytis hyacinthi TaxID=278943 RepID=A0A4Z1H0F3_9HELO|nr:hypothetical protein BHYA_0019g00280 [Botrytis hyacinthi]
MGVTFSQFFPLTPTLTEEDLPSQAGKVFIITGGASGVGLELATILYRASDKVYIAGRSEASAQKCIEHVKASSTSKLPGQLEYLPLELDDLSAIKSSAESFMKKETKLNVLWNNAGISQPELGSVSKQGFELQIATNCLGPFLFTQYLLPCLKNSAKESKPSAIRVVWTHSQFSELTAPKDGIIMSELDTPSKDQVKNYNNSKIGNWFLASELAKEVGVFGILSVSQNPGNLKTNLMRNEKSMYYAAWPLLYKAKMGAIVGGVEDGNIGACVVPWGRIHPGPREDSLLALKSSDEGGSGTAKKFWDLCEGKTAEHT